MKTATKSKKPESKKPAAIAPLVLPPGVMAGKEAILAGKVEQIPIDKIEIVSKQDREAMTDSELKIDELAQSIATAGLQQPIRVVEIGDNRFKLVFGERRLRACKRLGHQRISAVVVSSEAPANAESEARAVENIQRVDPSPIGEAVAIADLFEIKMAERLKLEGGDPTACVSIMAQIRSEVIATVAGRVGKPTAWVRDRMFLAGFSGKARDLVSSGRLPLAHAKEIAKVADPKRRDELAEAYAIGGDLAEAMSGEDHAGPIEQLRQEVARVCFSLAQVPWKLEQPFDAKPACVECPHNSLNNPGLFEGKTLYADDHRSVNKVGRYGGTSERPEPKSGVCLKPSCYQEKSAAASRALSGTVTKVLNKYEAAKAGKQKDADKHLGLSEIRVLTPAFVSPFAVKERAQERIEARSEKKKGPAKSTPSAHVRRPGDYGTPEYDAKIQGNRKYQAAATEWENKVATPALAKYLAAEEARWCMFALVQRSKPYEAACTYNAKPKDFASPELLRLLRLTVNPSIHNAMEIQKSCGTNFGLFAPPTTDDAPIAFQHAVLKAFGLEVKPPPVQDDFVKAEMDKLKKPAAKDSKKPAAKKAPKSKADTDEQEGEDE
jgi:uncharacterized ParB-like nuclease family protein